MRKKKTISPTNILGSTGLWLTGLLIISSPAVAQFTFEDVRSYPFPNALTVSATGSRVAWVFDEEGRRNVYVAQGPDFKARRLTMYEEDDGQEITSLSISRDGNWLVYVRGGDHGSNWGDEEPVNTSFLVTPPAVQIWSIQFEGGEPTLLAQGAQPVISPDNSTVAFVKGNQAWSVPIDGSDAARQLFRLRGSTSELQWSPDGSKLAFVSNRGDHRILGVYRSQDDPIQWLAPAFNRDRSPRWSPDGSRLAFIRTAGGGGTPDSILTRTHNSWAIMVVELSQGEVKEIWKAPPTLRGSIPTTHGRTNLHWGANDQIVFLSYEDGWPHLYAMKSDGSQRKLLTPGPYMAEHIRMSSDGRYMVFAGNTGPDPLDIDRRHVVRVDITSGELEVMTPGEGLEWSPAITGDGGHLVYISATAVRPPLPTVMDLDSRKTEILGEDLIPKKFRIKKLVEPKQIRFSSPDGLTIHGQWFETDESPDEKPAIIYIHGGPPRQMLLGWHYSSYYSNAYATNQYLASLGFIVITVNFRLGIGYGYEFHQAENAGWRGASEYQDIKAAGEWLAKQPRVDAKRIGVYGGSYGGYLTALALGKDSDLFAAGVDIHGVHNRTVGYVQNLVSADAYEKAPDAHLVLETAWRSSPVAYVDSWTSPVLVIHGDDDRNVQFSQSTDLVERLRKKGVPYESLVIVDDTHHWMRHKNSMTVGNATAEFFLRYLMKE